MMLQANAATIAAAKDAADATARTIQDITSIAIAVFTSVTAGLLWWYTKETQKLRVATEKMLKESQEQTKNIQKQTEIVLLPILIPAEGDTGRLVIRNVGSGPAFNIEIEPISAVVGVTNVRVIFKLRSDSLVQDENQFMFGEVWINNILTPVNSPEDLRQTLGNMDQNFSDQLAISYDSANEEHHRTEFTLTVWPNLTFVFKHRTRTRHGRCADASAMD